MHKSWCSFFNTISVLATWEWVHHYSWSSYTFFVFSRPTCDCWTPSMPEETPTHFIDIRLFPIVQIVVRPFPVKCDKQHQQIFVFRCFTNSFSGISSNFCQKLKIVLWVHLTAILKQFLLTIYLNFIEKIEEPVSQSLQMRTCFFATLFYFLSVA